MSVIEITTGVQLRQLITAAPHTIAVIDFYATWCGPCIAAAPRFASMAQQYTTPSGAPVNVVFCKVDVDRNPSIRDQYEIRAMPTFKVTFDGDVEDTVQGADLGVVESKLKMLIGYANSKYSAPAAAPPTPAQNTPGAIFPTGEPVSPLGRMFLELQVAIQQPSPAEAAAVCDRIYEFLLIKSLPAATGAQPLSRTMPFGLPLLSYLLSDAYFNPSCMEAFLKSVLSKQDALDETSFGKTAWGGSEKGFSNFNTQRGGVLAVFSIVGNMTNFIISALGKETWNVNDSANFQLNYQSGPLPPGMTAPARKHHYDGKFHRVVHRMLRVETIQRVLTNPGSFNVHAHAAATKEQSKVDILAGLVDMLAPHPLFLPPHGITVCQPKSGGKHMERHSLFGALLAPGIFPGGGMTANLLPLYLGQLFNPSKPVEQEIPTVRADIHARLSDHYEMTFPIVRELLGKKVFLGRSAALEWTSAFLTSNSAFGKEMHDRFDTASHTAMMVLMHVLVELALPVVMANKFESSIPPAYLVDLNADLPATLEESEVGSKLLYKDGVNVNLAALGKSDVSRHAEAEASDALPTTKPDEVPVSSSSLEALRRRLNQRSLVHFSSTSNKPTDVERVERLGIPALSAVGDDDALLPRVPTPLSAPTPAAIKALSDIDALLSGGAELDSDELRNALFSELEPGVGIQRHAPRVHLFFLALRAVSLAQTPLIVNIRTWKRHIDYPQVDARQKAFLRQRIEVSSSLVTCPVLALKTIQFMNGVAKWLLHILLQGDFSKALSTNSTPTVPPETWKYIPQVLFDTVFTTLELVTTFGVANVQHSDIIDILGLMLLLMGNLALFPKAHSHIPFPTIVLKFLEQPHMRDILTRHPWFQAHIVMGCVRTYMAMEGCSNERVPARYYTSCVLRVLLKDNELSFAARPILEDMSNGVMERFTHMVTSEANSAIDTILESLIKMRRLEESGQVDPASPAASSAVTSPGNGRGRGGDDNRRQRSRGGRAESNSVSEEEEEEQNPDSYPQLGEGLKQSLFLFSATIDAFKALSEQFPKGVLQNLVAQQIANMLARSLIKLAGRNSKELKISKPEMYNFSPREILANIVECIVRFKSEDQFIRLIFSGAVAESPPDGSNLFFALDNMLNPSRPLVFGMVAADLHSIREKLRVASKEILNEDELWGEDPPEFALCALMQTPLRDPVALPTTGDDLTFVEADVIHHALLKEEQNPFTRAKLTTTELEAFNATPRVQEALIKLRADIAQYLEQRRAELGRQ